MTTPTEEFISSFHSLSGTSIGERRKNLFLLLNKTRASSSGEIDFSSLHPKTPLEETFKVEALIYFRRIPDLVEVLKSENPVLIKKVLRVSSWFLEQAFQSATGVELVTFLLPYVSFNVKVKIVNKLSLYLSDKQKADSLFEAIRIKYGSYLAFKLLASCSEEFILQTVRNSGVKLLPRQLLVIVKKHPELSVSIFNALNLSMGEECITVLYKNVFLYLARTNHKLFLSLYNEYNPSFRLGWRATGKFIRENKQAVIKDADYFNRVLHRKQSAKHLKHDFVNFSMNFFPPTAEQFTNSFMFLYSYVRQLSSDEQKLNLLEETFRAKYGSELLENPRCLNTTILDLLPLNKRQSIPCKPHGISEDRWNCYMSIDHSVPYLKKRISLTSDFKTREDLVANLVVTCKINKDTKTLTEVCKYIVNQHRNDHVYVRHAFLSALRNYFDLEKLDEEHWTYIHELIQLFEMNDENFGLLCNFQVAYIHHCLLKGLPIEEHLTEYLKSGSVKWNLFRQYPVFEKRCLLVTGELLPQIFTDRHTLNLRYIDFLNSLIEWNKRHPKDEISLFNYPDAIDSFREVITDYGVSASSQGIINYILRLKSNINRDDLLALCLSKLNQQYVCSSITHWLLHNKPVIALNNIESITELLFKHSNRCFWKRCRNYTHLEVPQKLGASCLEALTVVEATREDFIKRKNAVIGLSYLMNAHKFLEFAADYYPTELRADAFNDEEAKKYKFQKIIASCLKNVVPPSLALQSILNFCKGDYLKLIQSSLYSVSGNVNEDKLPPFFSELAGRAVSVRKHTFHLTLRVLERSLIYSVFSKFMETEKNSSIRKFLFKGSFNLFVQDSDDYLWELVKSNMHSIHVDDREVVSILMNVNKIPPAYIERYVVFVWEFLENLPDPDGVIETEKFRLLRTLSADVMQLLPKGFCSEIIEKYLFKFDDEKRVTCNLNSFTCKFVIYCTSELEQSERMNAIFPILRDYIFDKKGRPMVDNFLREFCSEFLNQKCLSKEILSMFTSLWNSYIKPYKAFDHYLYLQFCLIYVDSVNDCSSPAQIGEKLAKFCDSISDNYGISVISVLCDILIFFLRYFCDDTGLVKERNRYFLIEGLMKASKSTACLITVIALLKRSTDYMEIELKHDEIVKTLTEIEDPLVQ